MHINLKITCSTVLIMALTEITPISLRDLLRATATVEDTLQFCIEQQLLPNMYVFYFYFFGNAGTERRTSC